MMLTVRPPMHVTLDDQPGPSPRPFGLTLDQRFYFPSRSHAAVLSEVRRALQQREGLVAVTGAAGTGKTLLCRTLLQELEPGVCASIVLDPRVTIEDLLLHVLTDFGVISSSRQVAIAGAPTRHQLMRALQHFLASLIPVWGSAIIVIDEAQDLDPEVLEHLRLLLNFEADEAKLLQIVLVGQPALAQMLGHASLRQLDDRVARRCVLEPLAADEIGPYIEHRMSSAQRLHRGLDAVLEPELAAQVPSTSVIFTPAAIRMFAARSRGIPRALNVLCDRALEIGYERRTTRIGWRIARAAGMRIHRRTPYRSPIHLTTRAALAAAAVLVLAVIGFGIRSWGGREPLPSTAPPTRFANIDAQAALSASVNVKELTIADSFNLRVASFRSTAGAADLAAQLEALGLPAFVRVERGTLHQVIVGPYLSHAEITGVQSRLAAFGHPGSDVFVEYYEPATADAGAGDRGLMALSGAPAR